MNDLDTNSDKKPFIWFIYFLFIIAAMFFRIPEIQNILLIMACFILNYSLYKRLKIDDKKLYISSLILIFANILFIYISYYNAIHLGFSDGLLYGQVGNNLYYDTWEYYYQSKEVSDFWLHGNFIFYFTGGIGKNFVKRGSYNYFILWNAFLNVLFGDNINSLIIIKYQFSIISIYLLYMISIQFLDKKYARLSVLLMNLFPGYLVVTTQLMRDNILFFFILAASYLVIINKDNENNKKSFWIIFIILIAIITYLRIYIGVILGAFLLLYYLKGKINIRNLILFSLLMMITIFIVGKITEWLGYGFLGSEILSNQDAIESGRWEAQKASSPIKLALWTFYTLFTGGRSMLSTTYFASFQEILNTISPLFISIFILPTLLIIFIKKNNKKNTNFILFSLFYSFFSSLIIYYYFTGIVPRLYICWIWSQLIIFAYIAQELSKQNGILKILSAIEYILYIIFISIVFIK